MIIRKGVEIKQNASPSWDEDERKRRKQKKEESSFRLHCLGPRELEKKSELKTIAFLLKSFSKFAQNQLRLMGTSQEGASENNKGGGKFNKTKRDPNHFKNHRNDLENHLNDVKTN